MTVSVNPNQPPAPLPGAGPAPAESEAVTQGPVVDASDRQTPEVERPSVSEVVQAAQDLSDYLSSAARSLQINVDGELESPIVTVLDTETEEVVRQIPSEELVALARFAAQQTADANVVSGVLINKEG